MRVYFVNVDPRRDPSHWCNAHTLFLRAAEVCGNHKVESAIRDADLILFCGELRIPMWPSEIWHHPAYRAFPGKCARVSTADSELAWLPGLYASLPYRYHCGAFRGGFYPHVAFTEQIPEELHLPSDGPAAEKPHLYSFMGAFVTHSVRSRIGMIQDERALIVDTSAHPGREYGQSAEVYATYRSSFAESLKNSLFVLCPRGMGASSIRIFEVMKAGRVPVIISDAWTPPDGPEWDACSLRVPECDVQQIPGLLRAAESRFPSMAAEALSAWRRFFSKQALLDYTARVASECLRPENRTQLWRKRLAQMRTVRCVRQGFLRACKQGLRQCLRPTRSYV